MVRPGETQRPIPWGLRCCGVVGWKLTIGDYYYQKLTIGGCHYYYYYYYYYYRSTTTTTTTTTTTNTNKCRTDSAWISDVDWFFYFFKSLVSRRMQRGRECPSQI